MKSFKDEVKARGWWIKYGSKNPATHLLLDGGRLSVPDDHAGTFLNVYINAILRKESVSAVEIKTPVFRLFFDVDARIDATTDTARFREMFKSMYEAVHEFFVLEKPAKMIVCSAPQKEDKCGFHVIFPGLVVNAPIALAFRDIVIQKLDDECPDLCTNPWADAIDPCVFKANGLRMLYSHKGPGEERAYIPLATVESETAEVERISDVSSQSMREYVHECSLRVFDQTLTPCAGGHDAVADQPHVHQVGGIVIGRSVPLEAYADLLPKVHAALPPEYESQRFVGIFKSEHAVMLRSSSRYCQNVGREHRTSTVYFCITRRGVCQKCYCRKDDHGCDRYSSQQYSLDAATLDAFVPSQCNIIPESLLELPSKKKMNSNLDGLLKRSRFSSTTSKKKKRKP